MMDWLARVVISFLVITAGVGWVLFGVGLIIHGLDEHSWWYLLTGVAVIVLLFAIGEASE